MKRKEFHLTTQAVHGASAPAKRNEPIAVPIVQSATFRTATMDEQIRLGADRADTFYTRYGNPTHSAVEALLAALEGAEAALLFASGMAAIATTLMATVRSGDHIVAQRELYGGTFDILSRWLPRFGVETTLVSATEPDAFARALRPNTRLIYMESPTNPLIRLVDLESIVAIARERHLLTVIDSTFATPINQRPLDWGVDVVIHSATKYLAGHSDVLGGVVCGSDSFIARLREARIALGGVIDPHAAWLLLRGLKTLAVRVERQNDNALQLARFLERHPRVKRVYYPFLETDPQYPLAKRLMRGGGGVLSFDLAGTADEARRFVDALELISLAPSLGGVETLVTLPAITSHAMLSAEERAQAGITDQLVRLSVGIEQGADLVADIERAFEAL